MEAKLIDDAASVGFGGALSRVTKGAATTTING